MEFLKEHVYKKRKSAGVTRFSTDNTMLEKLDKKIAEVTKTEDEMEVPEFLVSKKKNNEDDVDTKKENKGLDMRISKRLNYLDYNPGNRFKNISAKDSSILSDKEKYIEDKALLEENKLKATRKLMRNFSYDLTVSKNSNDVNIMHKKSPRKYELPLPKMFSIDKFRRPSGRVEAGFAQISDASSSTLTSFSSKPLMINKANTNKKEPSSKKYKDNSSFNLQSLENMKKESETNSRNKTNIFLPGKRLNKKNRKETILTDEQEKIDFLNDSDEDSKTLTNSGSDTDSSDTVDELFSLAQDHARKMSGPKTLFDRNATASLRHYEKIGALTLINQIENENRTILREKISTQTREDANKNTTAKDTSSKPDVEQKDSFTTVILPDVGKQKSYRAASRQLNKFLKETSDASPTSISSIRADKSDIGIGKTAIKGTPAVMSRAAQQLQLIKNELAGGNTKSVAKPSTVRTLENPIKFNKRNIAFGKTARSNVVKEDINPLAVFLQDID